MSDQQQLSVSYGSFSCDIIGFQDPLPVLQDVIGEFRQIAWRYPGFGTQKDGSQRDRLSRLVASKLNAALTDNGVSVTLDPETGGLLVQPIDGATKGEGWGDLYAKPKSPQAAEKSSVKHAAAAVSAAVTEPSEFETIEEPRAHLVEEISPVEPHSEIVAKIVEPAVEDEHEAEADETPAGAPPVEDIRAEAQIADVADPTEAEALEKSEAIAIEEPIDHVETAAYTPIESEVVVEETRDVAAVEAAKSENAITNTPEHFAEKEGDNGNATSDARPAVDDQDQDQENLIAAQIRQEAATVVKSEIEDAFAELRDAAAPAPGAVNEKSAAPTPVAIGAEKPKSGLFSRLLGAKIAPSDADSAAPAQDDSTTEPLHLTKQEGVAEPIKSDAKSVGRGDDAKLDNTFSTIARQLDTAEGSVGDDYVFASKEAETPKGDETLLLSSGNAVDPSEAEEAIAAEERVATAKAKVMERAKDRQAAETAASERRLRIIRRERVEEKSDEMTEALVDAAKGEPAMSAADFAKLTGAASLQELMEASAAYATLVSGKHKFTRSDVMDVLSELDKGKSYSPEAKIKSFGKMLRTGVLLRVDEGLFAMSQIHRHPYERKIHA